MSSAAPIVLRSTGLTKSYRKAGEEMACARVNLMSTAGERVAGPGFPLGKSTLLHLIAGLDAAIAANQSTTSRHGPNDAGRAALRRERWACVPAFNLIPT